MLRRQNLHRLPVNCFYRLAGGAFHIHNVASLVDAFHYLRVEWNLADKRQPVKTLHRWWDDLPAPPWLNGKALENSAQRLLAQTPHAPARGNFELWQQESFEIARAHAYPPGRTITPEFRAEARIIANRRVVEAGYRLGNLLQAIFGGVSRGTGSE